MVAAANLKIGRPRDGRARVNQIHWFKRLAAVLALIAASSLVTAIWAGSDNVTVG
jgi:hypothetical protein